MAAKKKIAKKNPVGRPSKYKPEFCQMVIDAMEKGLSKEAAAAECDICEDTFYRWVKKYPDFSEAVKQGERKSRLFWEKAGIQGMVGKIPGFNATTWIFNMKNRHGWRDKTETDIKSGGEPISNEWHWHPVTNEKE